MRSITTRPGWLARVGVLVVLALGFRCPALAGDDRLLVNVPESFEVGGRIFPAGLLSLRHLDDYNPTTAIDRISVGAECLGVYLAQRRPTEGGLKAASVVFERSPRGHLLLVGYTTGRDPAEVYLYRQPERGPRLAPSVVVASR
jgi:hypothetical protein